MSDEEYYYDDDEDDVDVGGGDESDEDGEELGMLLPSLELLYCTHCHNRNCC